MSGFQGAKKDRLFAQNAKVQDGIKSQKRVKRFKS